MVVSCGVTYVENVHVDHSIFKSVRGVEIDDMAIRVVRVVVVWAKIMTLRTTVWDGTLYSYKQAEGVVHTKDKV